MKTKVSAKAGTMTLAVMMVFGIVTGLITQFSVPVHAAGTTTNAESATGSYTNAG